MLRVAELSGGMWDNERHVERRKRKLRDILDVKETADMRADPNYLFLGESIAQKSYV